MLKSLYMEPRGAIPRKPFVSEKESNCEEKLI